jgi:hypothetical protein
MAPSDAQASASYGCLAVLSYWLRWLQVPIDWGQSIYHHGRAIVPNGSVRRASVGVLRLFGCFVLLAAVALGSDRLGTIDLPSW